MYIEYTSTIFRKWRHQSGRHHYLCKHRGVLTPTWHGLGQWDLGIRSGRIIIGLLFIYRFIVSEGRTPIWIMSNQPPSGSSPLPPSTLADLLIEGGLDPEYWCPIFKEHFGITLANSLRFLTHGEFGKMLSKIRWQWERRAMVALRDRLINLQ
jgi:hypothetical protein